PQQVRGALGQSGNTDQGHRTRRRGCVFRERAAPQKNYDSVGERLWKVHLLMVDASKGQLSTMEIHLRKGPANTIGRSNRCRTLCKQPLTKACSSAASGSL